MVITVIVMQFSVYKILKRSKYLSKKKSYVLLRLSNELKYLYAKCIGCIGCFVVGVEESM